MRMTQHPYYYRQRFRRASRTPRPTLHRSIARTYVYDWISFIYIIARHNLEPHFASIRYSFLTNASKTQICEKSGTLTKPLSLSPGVRCLSWLSAECRAKTGERLPEFIVPMTASEGILALPFLTFHRRACFYHSHSHHPHDQK